MSASPSGMPNGQQAPPKGVSQIRRKPRPVNPLVAQKKKPKARSTFPPPVTSKNSSKPLTGPAYLRPVATKDEEKKLADFEAERKRNGGWTEAYPPAEYSPREFPLVTTKRALKEGIRCHVMRFAKAAKGGNHDEDIDPTNQDDFTRPVSLHRRDPRQPPPGRAVKEEAPTPPPADDKDDERLAQQKAEREAQRAADMAQVAPASKDASKKGANQKKDKPVQAFLSKGTKEQKKEQELRYEEALPWHLEDADGKNVWVGSYVSALSEANVAFVISGSGFRMVPLEKYYRFTPKHSFSSYTIEEAERLMKPHAGLSRWAMRDLEKNKAKSEYEATRTTISGRISVKQESVTFRSAPRSETMDQDDIDMEGDEFQDDDDNAGLEPDNDDDAKDTRERMRRDQLGANLFGEADEHQVEKEEADKLMAELHRKLDGKRIRKALTRRDKNGYFESESDESYSGDDEGEKKGEDEDKKDDDSKSKAESKDKSASGTASKGDTTPSGKQKLVETSKKPKSLKRPGSPNLSESSGNESSRKKVKKETGSVRPSRSTTPMPGHQNRKVKGHKQSATSDGEGTAGEMSDGGPTRKKIKIVGTGAKGTPIGSRAGSPVPSQGLAPGSNSASPTKGGPSTPRSASFSAPVEASEIVEAIRAVPHGINVGTLLRQFGNRVGEDPGQMPRKEWIKLVKENAFFGPDKLLHLKSTQPQDP